MSALVQRLGADRGRFGPAAAVILLATVGVLSLGLAPQIVDGLIATGMTASRAGLCITADIGSGLFGALLVYFFLDRMSPRAVGAAALGLMLVGNLVSGLGHGFNEILIGRVLAGLGAGLTSLSFPLLSQGSRPARGFALYNAVSILATAAIGWLSAVWISEYGVKVLFLTLAVAAAVSVPSMLALPSLRRDVAAAQERAVLGAAAARNRIRTCLMMTFYFFSFGGLWPFVGALGLRHGLDAVLTDQHIANGVLVGGLVASALTVLLENRVTPLMLLKLLMPLQAAVLGILVLTSTAIAFLGGNIALNIGEYLFFSFNMSLLAQLDSSGRFAVVGSIIQTLGFALGPALAGIILDRSGVVAVVPFCATGYALTLIFLLTIRMDKHA
jgi:predicted MFS family arabinose efflux permease